jgi:S1-C subfamily serine protease
LASAHDDKGAGTVNAGVDANVGVAFALPVEAVRSVTKELSASGHVRRSWLGVHGVTITPALADLLPGLPPSGALVTEVLNGGPALAAGIRAGTGNAWVDGGICAGGDSVVAMGGTAVAGMSQLLRRINNTPVGARVTLTVIRAGAKLQIPVTLETQPTAHPGVAMGCSL